MFSEMGITDVIPVLLIFQLFANVYGDSPLFQTNPQSRQQQDQSIQQLAQSLQQIDQSFRQSGSQYQQLSPQYQQPYSPYQQRNPPEQQPFSPYQTPNLPQQQPYSPYQQSFPQQQPFSPYQHTNIQQQPFSPYQPSNSPQQQPLLPYQQPNFAQPQPFSPVQDPNYILQQPFLPSGYLQQPNLPQQQTYGPFQQPYPPLPGYYQRSFQQFQPPTCPLPAPICADGRPAVCAWTAAMGLAAYSCPIPTGQAGVPSPSKSTPSPSSAGPSSKEPSDSHSKGPGVHHGGRSLLEIITGPNSDTAPQPIASTNPLGQSYPGTNPLGQGYPGPNPLGQGYPGPNPLGQGYPGTSPWGQGYPGTNLLGQGYPVPNPLGQGYPGPNPLGQGYPGTNPPVPGYSGTSPLGQGYPGTPGSLQHPNEPNYPNNKLICPFRTLGCLNCCIQPPILLAALAGLQSSVFPSLGSLRASGPLNAQCKPGQLGYPCSSNFPLSSTLGTPPSPGQLEYPQPAVSPYYPTGISQGRTEGLPLMTGIGLKLSPYNIDHGFAGMNNVNTNPWSFGTPIAFRSTAMVPGLQASSLTEYHPPTVETQWKVIQPPIAGQIISAQQAWPVAGPYNSQSYISPGNSPLPGQQPMPPNNPYQSQNQPVLTEPISHLNQPPFSGGLYSPANQPTYPGVQPTGNPSIFPKSKTERQPRLRTLEPQGYQSLPPWGYPVPQSTFQNVPIYQGTQSLGNPLNPNPTRRTEGSYGYQVQPPAAPLIPGSLAQGVQPSFQPGFQAVGVQVPLQPGFQVQTVQPVLQTGFQSTYQLPLPLTYHHLVSLPRSNNPYYQTLPYFQNPTLEKRRHEKGERNPQNPSPFLTSGLSLLSELDTEPPHGYRSLDSDDDLPQKKSKKTSRHPKKQSSSSTWL